MDQSGSIRAAMSVYGRPSRNPICRAAVRSASSPVSGVCLHLLRLPETAGGMGCLGAGQRLVWRAVSGAERTRGDEGGHRRPRVPWVVSKFACFALKRREVTTRGHPLSPSPMGSPPVGEAGWSPMLFRHRGGLRSRRVEMRRGGRGGGRGRGRRGHRRGTW
jgi:hypothetical protein